MYANDTKICITLEPEIAIIYETPALDKIQTEIDTMKKQLFSLKELKQAGFSDVTRDDI